MKIEIEITKNTASDLADITCFLAGWLEGKKAEGCCFYDWLGSSLMTLREINTQIKKATDA